MRCALAGCIRSRELELRPWPSTSWLGLGIVMSAKGKLTSSAGRERAQWLQTTTREELRNTLGWSQPRLARTRHRFSAHHPTIPRRYVPEWQTDMKNRALIVQVRSTYKNITKPFRAIKAGFAILNHR